MSLLSISDAINNPTWFTPWSFMHFMSGFVSYAIIKIIFPNTSLLDKFLIWMCIHTIYEIKDICKAYLDYDGSFWSNNSFINSLGDTICAAFGFIIGYIVLDKAANEIIILMLMFYVYMFVYFMNTTSKLD